MPTEAPATEKRKRAPGAGRPTLHGVRLEHRSVSLTPEQWAWLARQPGGAPAALRRLVAAAQRAP